MPFYTRLRHTLFACYIICVAFIASVVVATAYIPARKHWLNQLTQENGLFEWGTVAVLLLVALYGLVFAQLPRIKRHWTQLERVVLLVLGSAALIAAMEEISWGQQVFEFESSGVFLTHNLQQETNLHNFVNGLVVSATLNVSVYMGFIFLPIFVRFFPSFVSSVLVHGFSDRWKKRLDIWPLLPSIHCSLMFCFASLLQAYWVPLTLSDTFAIVFALILYGVFFVRDAESKDIHWSHWLHWGCLLAFMQLFMFNSQIFHFINYQYEIREFMIVLGVLYWLIEWGGNRTCPKAD